LTCILSSILLLLYLTFPAFRHKKSVDRAVE